MKGKGTAMKKMTAAVAAAVIMFTYSSALAYDVEVEMNSFTFDVSMRSDIQVERPTIQMFDKDKTKLIYVGEGESIQDGNEYVFTFDKFNVPSDLETGEYIIMVGGSGIEAAEKTIDFVNNDDKGNALNAVNEAEDISKALQENAGDLGIDIVSYSELGSEWKKSVDDVISELDLSNDLSVEQVEQKYKLFYDAYNAQLEIAVIAGSNNAESVKNMIEKSSYTGLDLETWYSKLTNKTEIADILVKQTFTSDITAQTLNKEFDGAVLVSVINQLDWGSGYEAMKYYESKDIIDINFDQYSKLSQTNQSNVFKDLKSIGLDDYEDIPFNFNRLVSSYSNSSGTTGNVGPGSSNGSSGTVTSNPGLTAPVVTDSPSATPVPEDKIEFVDMNEAAWAEEAVNALSEKGVISGDGNGHFRPQDSVTREEFAKMIVMTFGLYDSLAVSDFDDVPEDAWYADYVASAYENGIVTGISETSFGAGLTITRQDMAVMLYRIYDMSRCDTQIKAADNFSDAADIADYAQEAVEVLNRAGVLNGNDDGCFYPKGNVTRAQSAKALYELMKIVG